MTFKEFISKDIVEFAVDKRWSHSLVNDPTTSDPNYASTLNLIQRLFQSVYENNVNSESSMQSLLKYSKSHPDIFNDAINSISHRQEYSGAIRKVKEALRTQKNSWMPRMPWSK